MNKEEQMRQEAGAAWAELDSLIMRMRIEENSAHSELDRLNEKLPRILVEWAKGNVSRREVNAIKARMAELRDMINDIPTILRQLELEKRNKCFRPLQDAFTLSSEREKYKVLKARIFDRFEPTLVDDLRRCARDIGEEEDCEQFLACLTAETSDDGGQSTKQ